MAARFSRAPWKLRQSRRAPALLEIRDGNGDRIAVVYTGIDDGSLMTDSRRILGELKHMVAIARMREGELRASERAALKRARDLIAAH